VDESWVHPVVDASEPPGQAGAWRFRALLLMLLLAAVAVVVLVVHSLQGAAT